MGHSWKAKEMKETAIHSASDKKGRGVPRALAACALGGLKATRTAKLFKETVGL
jgi:hypothetical protein